jgi:hypothetical protein
VPGAGDAGGAQDGLHPGLVPDVERRLDVHALDAERLADLRQRHLELLQRPDEAFHPAEVPAQTGRGLRDLARIERVVDPPVAVEVLPQRLRETLRRLGGDQGQPHVRKLGGRVDEPRGGRQQERRDERSDDHAGKLPPSAVRVAPRHMPSPQSPADHWHGCE